MMECSMMYTIDVTTMTMGGYELITQYLEVLVTSTSMMSLNLSRFVKLARTRLEVERSIL